MSGWNNNRIELLKKHWNDGLSASEIASKLGDISRSAVLGKAHRLGLSGRVPGGRPMAQSNTKKSPMFFLLARPKPAEKCKVVLFPNLAKSKTQAVAQPLIIDFKPIGISFLDLKPRQCKWALGDLLDAPVLFCGHDSMPFKPYCLHHLLLSVPAEVRARLARSLKEAA